MRHVPLFAVIILTALSFYSVSAQIKGDAISMPAQYTEATSATDSQTVLHLTHLSNYYLNVDNDSSLYWADRTISFALLKNNLQYLQYGLLARKQAEQSILNITTGQNAFLLDAISRQKQWFTILFIACIIFFIATACLLVLYAKQKKQLNKPAVPEINIEPYEEKIKYLHNSVNELEQKNADLQRGYEELQTKFNDLQKTNEIKDKLIPMIAHDIRSPLASLQSTLSLTRENIISPEEFQKLSFALEADVFNLRGMLDNMLLWAREQMFEIKINKVRFDLSEVSKDVILMYRNNLVGKNIMLHNYLPTRLEVNTDKEIIAAVFRNLFSNAVKFTEAGKNIYISQIFFNGKAYISIKDEGKGMPPETIRKIKNKEHISTRGTANEKGTGLGLLFSREMVNKLDEVFDITSYPDQGTSVTFSVSLS